MNEIEVLLSLRPEVAPLDQAAKADLRRSILGEPVAGGEPAAARDYGDDDRSPRVTATRPAPQRARWVTAVAAAALAIAGTTGLWALTTRRTDQPSAQGEVAVETAGEGAGEAAGAATTPLPDWYEPVRALLPPGFDQIAIMPAAQNLYDGELYVVAAQPSSGLVLHIAIDTRAQSTDVDIEDGWFTDQWGAYLDNIERTTLVTPDRRWVRVRCGVTVMDGARGVSASEVAMTNDVCDAAGGPTVTERRAVAARFADAADRGELSSVLAAAAASAPAAGLSEAATDAIESMPSVIRGGHSSDFTGRSESIEVQSGATDGLTSHVWMLYGVLPAAGDTDPQVNKITLGARSERSLASYPEAPTVDQIATVTFVRGGVLYQAVTTDVSDSNLAGLQDLLRQLADRQTSSITVPPTLVAPTDPTTPTAESTIPSPQNAESTVGPAESSPPSSSNPANANTDRGPAHRRAVGDSVLVSAASRLESDGWTVTAEAGLQAADVAPVATELARDGLQGDLVLVHVGNNGELTQQQIDAVLAPLADAELVVLYNINADRPWRDANNELLAQAAPSHPNVQLIDWNALASSCPGDCFYADGIHLRPDGVSYYEQLATDAWVNR